MARTTGTVSLTDLIREGKLQLNEKLIIRRRSASPIEGTLLRDGGIKVGSTTYPTPSRAAREELGSRAADGWTRWRVPRLADRTLAEIREEGS